MALIKGALKEVLPKLEQQFNLANLDFVGHLSEGTLNVIAELLNDKLDSKALVAVTLQDTELATNRTKRAGLGDGGWREFERHLRALVGGRYAVEPQSEIRYAGGTTQRDTPMVTLVFRLRRRGE